MSGGAAALRHEHPLRLPGAGPGVPDACAPGSDWPLWNRPTSNGSGALAQLTPGDCFATARKHRFSLCACWALLHKSGPASVEPEGPAQKYTF